MQFVTKEIVGQGNYGETFKVVSADGTTRAAKFFYVYLKEYYPESKRTEIIDLLNRLKDLKHTAILNIFEVLPKGIDGDKRLAIVTDYCPISLVDAIPHLNPTQRLINLYGIAEAMRYLHSQNMLHHDLKTSNILVDDNYYPKLKDIQFSTCIIGLTDMAQIQECSRFVAPEMYSGQMCKASEVFAYGMICYQIFTGKEPFEGLNQVKRMRKVLAGERPELPDDLNSFYKVFIQKCWEQKPEDRPTFAEICEILKMIGE